MPLLDLWKSARDAVLSMSIDRVVGTAGEDGQLRDGSRCSAELREFLTQVDSQVLAKYARYCAETAFPNSGRVLQDVVNELGRRLDFQVDNGRYQGTPNGVGFDGLWQSAAACLVVECKTTDTYTIPLEKLDGYKTALVAEARARPDAGVLLVVARQDTGALEAQVRGSPYAWSMRIIGLEALIKLVSVKESAVGDEIVRRIHSLLLPVEYTRLDRMVDAVFAVAEDKDAPDVSETTVVEARAGLPAGDLTSRKSAIASSLGARLGTSLLRRKFSLYSDPSDVSRIAVVISRRYEAADRQYWYAYQQVQREWLAGAKHAFMVLGLDDQPRAFAIPFAEIEKFRAQTHVRQRDREYWDLYLRERDNKIYIWLPMTQSLVDLSEYEFPL